MSLTWTPVQSSQINAVAYDLENSHLFVEFKGGGTYRYEGVPMEKVKAMLKHESAGRYLSGFIKGTHPCIKVASRVA